MRRAQKRGATERIDSLIVATHRCGTRVGVAIVEGRDDLLFEQPVERVRVGGVHRVVVVAGDAAVDHPAVACR